MCEQAKLVYLWREIASISLLAKDLGGLEEHERKLDEIAICLVQKAFPELTNKEYWSSKNWAEMERLVKQFKDDKN